MSMSAASLLLHRNHQIPTMDSRYISTIGMIYFLCKVGWTARIFARKNRGTVRTEIFSTKGWYVQPKFITLASISIVSLIIEVYRH